MLSYDDPRRLLKTFRWVQWVMLCAGLAVLAAYIGWNLYADYKAVDRNERQRLATQARIIDAALVQQLAATNDAMETLRTDWPLVRVQQSNPIFFNQRLSALVAAMPAVRTLNVLDANGTALASNHPELLGQNFGQRPYFVHAKQHPNVDALQISSPFKTVLGVYSMALVKVLHDKRGTFAGVVTATLDPAYVATLLDSVRYAPDVATLLVHGNGVLLQRQPSGAELEGSNLADAGSLFMRHLDSGQVVSVHEDEVDPTGQVRMVAVRTLRSSAPNLVLDEPLVVMVERNPTHIFAAWRRSASVQGLFLALVCIAAVSGLWWYQRRQRVYVRAASAHADELSHAQLALQANMRFTKTLADSMPSMSAYWGRDLRCGFANQAYIRWFGLTSEKVIGATMQDVLGQKLFFLNQAHVQAALQGVDQQFERTMTNADGQTAHMWVQYVAQRVDGEIPGFFALLTDISQLKLSQEKMKASDQELRIAAIAFESQEAIFVTDSNTVILKVNHAFTRMTGYSAADAIGQTPRLLSSGKHDQAFYTALWHSVATTGAWQGEIWNRRKDGGIYPQALSITGVKNADGQLSHYVANMVDISARKAAEDAIHTLAFFDPLTKLPNRRLLMDRLGQVQSAAARHQRKGALLFIDLDNFKNLNDTHGHYLGDCLLEQVAQRLQTCVREGDTVARLGGDEFVVMLEDLSSEPAEAAAQAELVGQKIRLALNQVYVLGTLQHHSTPSIGVTLFAGTRKEGLDEPLKRADLAMYQAKAAGRNTMRFFDAQMQTAVTLRAAMETDLRTALVQQQFVLNYQAQVDQSGRVVGAEILLRWRHPERGIVGPNDFIATAEGSGLIVPLGLWVLETACTQLAVWALQPEQRDLTLAVNVSALQFQDADFVNQVLAVLERTGAPAHQLKLELTESLMADRLDDLIGKMQALKERGVRFSLDDFGTGFSSLSYLKRLPLYQLKIDRAFVRDVLTDPNDAAIAEMVIALASTLGLEVIAEGVETLAQQTFLAEKGCTIYQGYLYSHPLALAEFEVLHALRKNMKS